MKTNYESAERDDLEDLFDKTMEISSLEHIRELLGSVSTVILILNEKRQVVFANDTLLEKYNIKDTENVLGFKPGELMSCQNAKKMPGGCGASKNCRYCGVVNAIVDSRKENRPVTREARITMENDNDFIQVDLSITARPFHYKDYVYTIYAAEDITDRKQKELMERVFFHDIINLAGSLDGIMGMIEEMDDKDATKFFGTAQKISNQLLEEILSHQDIMKAEKNELNVTPEALVLGEFINDLCEKIKPHRVAQNKTVFMDKTKADEGIVTDKVLLERVLFNMLKNALEASMKGETVTISAEQIENERVLFKVQNPAYMTQTVQLQIFQRSFSTKGDGRGLGTYSMKLFGEKYLKGIINFTSSIEKGTTFTLNLPLKLS